MERALRVVVIDDDPDLRKLIKLSLEFTAGWEVTTAPDGAEGVKAVETIKPDMVVADVMMPGMDGYEVSRRLKENSETAAIPVLLLTARKELDVSQVESNGVAGVVFKPFEPTELADRIRELCGVSDG